MTKLLYLTGFLLAAALSQTVLAGEGKIEAPKAMKGPGESGGSVSQPLSAQTAASAEVDRVNRIKLQIKNGQEANPSLDKLAPYLGRRY